MANITVSLSQNVINTDNTQNTANGSSTFSDLVDLFFKGANNYSTNHYYYSSASSSATTLRLNFSDGSYTTYNGVVMANPSASSGSATATSVDAYWPSHYRLTYSGNLNYEYNGTSFHSTSSTINAAAIQTLLPTYSTGYNSTLGNVLFSLKGSITDNSSDDFTGVITSITGKADHFVDSSTISGTFNVSGNGSTIALNLGTTSVSGVLNSYSEKYLDGSSVTVTSAVVPITSNSIIDEHLFSDPASFPGNDVISINLPSTLYSPWVIASGSGDDNITLQGGGSSLSANAGDGNDTIISNTGNHAIDGGSGFDTVTHSGNRANYLLTNVGSTISVKGPDGTDTLTNIEYLQFSDQPVVIAPTNTSNQYAALLYQGALGRTPEPSGLAYWVNLADNLSPATKAMGVYGLSDASGNYNGSLSIAGGFTWSVEFIGKYGSLTNEQFVTQLYANVLDRAPDPNGFNDWVGQLGHGTTREHVLIGFAESVEAISNATVGFVGVHGQHAAWLVLT